MVHHLLNYIHSLVKSVFFLKKKTEKKLHIYWLTKTITQAIDLNPKTPLNYMKSLPIAPTLMVY
jgi:hypothetical protein